MKRRTLAVFGTVILLLTACGGQVDLEPEPSMGPALPTPSEEVTPAQPALDAEIIDLKQVAPAAAALETSESFFTTARQVILAPVEDEAAQALAASFAVQAGVPVLLVGDLNAELNRELIRLGVHGLITVGEVDIDVIDATGLTIAPLIDLDSPAVQALDGDQSWVDPDSESSVRDQLVDLQPGQLFGPIGSAAIEPEGQPALERFAAEPALEGAVLLADEFTGQLAVANALAATVQVVAFDDEPLAESTLLDELGSSGARVIASYAGISSDIGMQWQIAAALSPHRSALGTLEVVAADTVISSRSLTAVSSGTGFDLQAALEEQSTLVADALGDGVTTVGALELTVADRHWRRPEAEIQAASNASQAAQNHLILVIAPANEEHIPEILEHMRPYLSQPHVSLEIDPQFMSTPLSDEALRQISAHLLALTHEFALPQKLLVISLFSPSQVESIPAVVRGVREVPILVMMSGHGTFPSKLQTWEQLRSVFDFDSLWGWRSYPGQDQSDESAALPEPASELDLVSTQ